MTETRTHSPMHGAAFGVAGTSLLLAALLLAAPPAGAQQPLTRSEAIAAALARAPRIGIARADSQIAQAQLLTARTRPNPILASGYSKSTPQYRFAVDLPLDLPTLRNARVGAARAGLSAALYRFRYDRALLVLDADTAYTRAAAARARAGLAERNVRGADRLRAIAVARRDAGDASDLDVELATIFAGQQANLAAADSLALFQATSALQLILGLSADPPVIVAVDSLTPVPYGTPPSAYRGAEPLPVLAAAATLEAAEFTARLQRRQWLAGLSVNAGFEMHDPATGNRPLPTAGINIPLQIFNRNRGPIAEADALRDRARFALELARLESRNQLASAMRALEAALARVERGQRLVASATRVVEMSVTAYQEGAATLTTVLETQRNARDILTQLTNDLAEAWVAAALVRALAPPADGTTR